ncbi:antibiotic biosynthesis monooxygenase [Xanthomonas campestris pv. phormiicola]|nr:antibiotic biosynthesis monooxygenase [Xanthomonas campestris pv. phormiicola]UYC17259.1 antibiotic biosynthesis monooxygenase [Xanthomonas campestris pv. phormiicola]
MFVTIWEYEVADGQAQAFETLYAADGAWAALFAEYPGYLGTELLRAQAPGAYLSIDRWRDEADYTHCLAYGRERYAQLDRLGDALTTAERCVGYWGLLTRSG